MDPYVTGARVRDRFSGLNGRVAEHESIRTVKVLWEDGSLSLVLRYAAMTQLEVIRS